MKECPECRKCLDDDQLNCPQDNKPLNVSLKGSCLIDGKYLLERCLGRGAMGSVYQVMHKELQKSFALKLIQHSALSDPAYLARFRIEAKALGRLQHPNIVQVTDYGIDPRNGGLPYLVMEYLEGTTLLHHLQEKGFQKFEEALPLLESIANAIDYAHSCGILHRDLKLQNIFLVRNLSGELQVKILDFGLARMAGEHLVKEERVKPSPSKTSIPKSRKEEEETQTLVIDEKDDSFEQGVEGTDRLTRAGSVMGTPGYIPPEIFEGIEATPASDVYSFGVLIYEVLVGHRPYKDSNIKAMLEQPWKSPPLPSSEQPSVPKELDQALLASIQKEPNMRPAMAIDVIDKLKKAYAGYQYRMWRTQEVPKRLWFAGALTIVFILLYWIFQVLPVVKRLENFVVDYRIQLLPLQPPDERILLVSIDEATLQADPVLLVEKADEMGVLLQSVLDAGARGVAIDFLLPGRWNQSESFAKLILKNQGKLVLSSYIKKDGSIMGMECIEGLIMAALGSTEPAEELFGFLNMQPDFDDRIRRMPIGLRNQEGRRMNSMSAKAFQVLTSSDLSSIQVKKRIWIDYSIDWNKFQRISWKDLPLLLNQRPDFFNNKFVLVGGEYEGSQDFHRIPKRSGREDEASGLVIQALTLNTLLQNKLIQDVDTFFIFLLLAIVFMIFSSIFLIRPKIFSFLIILFILLTGYFLIWYFLFIWNRQLLTARLPALAFVLALVPVFLVRHRLNFVAKPLTEVNK
jgi:serine/threonine protein kinase/CHASE2 domain-containing sensor protein